MIAKQEKIYEGKAKILFKTNNPNHIIQYFKDDATAFNNIKKDNILGKGVLNNIISEHIMKALDKHQIATHFIERIDNRSQLVKEVSIIPLEVIVRNKSAGSICKRLGLKEGNSFNAPIVEFSYKNDDLGDPLINDDHVIALNIINRAEIDFIKTQALSINKILGDIFAQINIELIDFKIEFGKNKQNEILLADEISPDSCRLWDIETAARMDKDRFRLDLGSLIEYYSEIAQRWNLTIPNFKE